MLIRFSTAFATVLSVTASFSTGYGANWNDTQMRVQVLEQGTPTSTMDLYSPEIQLAPNAVMPDDELVLFAANYSQDPSGCTLNAQFQAPSVHPSAPSGFFFLFQRSNGSSSERRKSGKSSCDLQTAAQHAEHAGASAVLFYAATPDYDWMSLKYDFPTTIPVWVVSYEKGLMLANAMEYTFYRISDGEDVLLRARISSMAIWRPTFWDYTLIIVIALLGVSFVISMGLHCHLFRSRRRHPLLAGQDNQIQVSVAMDRSARTLSEDELKRGLPTRIYQSQQTLAASGESERDLGIGMQPIGSTTAAVSSSVSSWAMDDLETCVICIDPFEDGQELRTLPCHHEYHVKCIDPWLLQKHAVCPLCKAEVHVDPDTSGSTDSSRRTTTHIRQGAWQRFQHFLGLQ